MNNAENCKVVLIGESGMNIITIGVGKTSIINRFVNNSFNTDYMPTLGASYTSRTLFMEDHNKMIKFEVKENFEQ